VVDPHRLDCTYPDPDLTGAGLAYKLAAALLARRGVSVDGLAALAALGTIADVAPMTGESRAIVRLGLDELAVTEQAGLRELLARSSDRSAPPTTRDLAFGVVPRINAAGRIADAELAIGLLLETDPAEARRLADELEEVHVRRRELTAVAVRTALERAAGLPGAGPLVIRDDGWPAGLLGLIAGRLVDTLARPAVVAALVGGEVRGSVRAPADFHVAAALDACAAWLAKRGGHAAAGGFSVSAAAWDEFRVAFGALSRPFPPGGAGASVERPGRLPVDLVLPARYLDWRLAEQLARLAPFGPGHVEPVLAVTGMELVEGRRVGAEGSHVAFRMRRGLEAFDAVAFGVPADVALPANGSRVDVVGTLERDDFNGFPRLRLRMLDFADADASPLLARRLPPLLAAAG
jgi:single-stranded-DNA-specific exonuclease